MIKFKMYYLFVLIYIPLIIIFGLLERFLEPKYVIYASVDAYIPYIKYFVIFYFIWFLYMFAATLYFMFFSKEDFLKLTAFMSVGMALSFIVFLAFPNEQPLRPYDPGDGVTGFLVSWLYTIDTPTNVCPSIHIINSMAVHICVVKSKKFGNNRIVKSLSFFTMVMINLSTMFIKQHSVIDVAAGLAVTALIYTVVFNVIFKQKKPAPIYTKTQTNKNNFQSAKKEVEYQSELRPQPNLKTNSKIQ